MCRKCRVVIPAGDVVTAQLAEVQLRRLRKSATARMRVRKQTAGGRAVADALVDMESACELLDVAVRGICKQHHPMGCLPPVLALATGAIVAGVTARTVRWYFAVVLSFVGGALIFVVLMVFRIVSWSRHHPLLAAMYMLQHIRGDEDADFDRIELSEAIVRHYLPEAQGAPLLARLETTKQRAARLLGLDDDEPSSRGRA